MKTLLDKLETSMVAATYAEAGEFETARAIMKEKRQRKTKRPESYNEKRPVARNQMRAD